MEAVNSFHLSTEKKTLEKAKEKQPLLCSKCFKGRIEVEDLVLFFANEKGIYRHL